MTPHNHCIMCAGVRIDTQALLYNQTSLLQISAGDPCPLFSGQSLQCQLHHPIITMGMCVPVHVCANTLLWLHAHILSLSLVCKGTDLTILYELWKKTAPSSCLILIKIDAKGSLKFNWKKNGKTDYYYIWLSNNCFVILNVYLLF